MRKHLFTDEEASFIKSNYLKISGNDIGRLLKCDGAIVRRFIKKNGLIVPVDTRYKLQSVKRTGITTYTKVQDDFIVENYLTMPIKKIADEIGGSYTGVMLRLKNMGLTVPADVIQRNKESARIKPGNVPSNKGKKQVDYMTPEMIERTAATRFKKGNVPYNTKEADGAITIRHDHDKRGGRPYKFIRLSLGKWELLHKVLWEKINGRVPAGHCLWFIDGDSLNCDVANLELITRLENRIRNSGTRDLSDHRVATYLATSSRSVDPALRNEILEKPDLIIAKRNQLLINRKIKQYGTK